jgi:hypothetical protein
MLQTKFEIKGMYEEIYNLKRENEELWRIWERVRRTGPAQGSSGGGMMHLTRLLLAFFWQHADGAAASLLHGAGQQCKQ